MTEPIETRNFLISRNPNGYTNQIFVFKRSQDAFGTHHWKEAFPVLSGENVGDAILELCAVIINLRKGRGTEPPLL